MKRTMHLKSILAASAALLLAGCPQPTPGAGGDPVVEPTPTPVTGNLQLGTDDLPRNSWRIGPPLSRERGGLSAGIFNGQLYAIGGDGEATLEILDPNADRWRTVPLPFFQGDPSQRSRYFGSAVTAWNRIFYIGGTVDWLPYLLDVYEPGTPDWLELSSSAMQHGAMGRMAHASAALEEEILVIGGLRDAGGDEKITTDSVISLKPGTSPGTYDVYNRPNLPQPRAGLGSGVIGSQLYVAGGFIEAPVTGSPIATDSVLRYHADAWHTGTPEGAPLASMNVPRHSFGMAVLDGILYVAGGLDSTGKALDSVEAYDPKTNQWTLRAPMFTPRAHLGLAANAGRLYAIGGFDADGKPLRSVHVFRP